MSTKRPSPNSGYNHNKKARLSPPCTSYADPVITRKPPPGLTVANATETLQRYVGWLRNKPQDGLSFSYDEVTIGGKQHQYATALLPHNTNVRERKIRSDSAFATPILAKRNASFHAVCELWAVGEIDDDLMPTPATPSKPGPPPSALKNLGSTPTHNHSERNERERERARDRRLEPRASTTDDRYDHMSPHDVSRKVAREMLGPKDASDEHEMLSHPSYWTRQSPMTPNAYISVIKIAFPKRKDLEPLCRQVCIVTSRPLPFGKEIALDLPDYNTHNFRIFPHVRLGPSEPLRLSEEQLDVTFEWTRKFVRCLTNQPIDGLLEKAPYLFLPLVKEFDGIACTANDIAWKEVYLVDGPGARELDLRDNNTLLRSLEDAVLCTSYELGRRHYILRIRQDLTPHSPAPRRPDVSILDLTKGHGDFPMARLRFHDQPIVESEHVVTASHGGWLTTLNQPKPLQHLIPEFLFLHFLPATVLRTATFVPTIMSALDEHLIATECNQEVFGGKLDQELVQQAITTPAVRPAPFNYQRLEMLGDTLLHFVASVDVYRNAEPGEEGEADMGHELRKERHLLVSNRTLGPAAAAAGVVKYVRYRPVAKRDYCPPGWVHEVDGAPDEDGVIKAELGGKIPADVAEALLGAAYLSGGKSLQSALDAIHTLHIPIKLRSADELRAGSVLSRLLGKRSETRGPLQILDYEFRDPAKGRSVMRLPPSAGNFEQYSFLGNAVLELLTLEKLWEQAELTPAELTIMKQNRVSGVTLGAFAVSSGIVDMMSVAPENEERFGAFVAEMRAAETLADVQEEAEFWTQLPEYKYLGASFQALMGAMADDCAFDLPILRKMYAEHVAPWMTRFGGAPTGSRTDSRTKLEQFLHAKGCRDWSIQRGAGQHGNKRVTDVLCHGQEVGHGVAHSIAHAIVTACDDALLRLPSQIETICTCTRAR